MLENDYTFDAVLTSEDMSAIGALKCLKANNLNVPADVSVMGFNNSILSICCTPTLSTVDSKTEQLGQIAVKVLHAVLQGEKVDPDTIIEADLVLRQTT